MLQVSRPRLDGGEHAGTLKRKSGGGSTAVLEAPALVAGLDDVAVVGQAVEHGGGHLGIAEHLGPVGEGQVGGDQQRRVLIEFADQVEQQLPPG